MASRFTISVVYADGHHDDSASAGSKSASSGTTIIGENTGVFIGGLPENFTLLREDSGKTKIHRSHMLFSWSSMFPP